jgi:hypothetical protein
VLHQDISYGNILLLPEPPYVVLIDVDLAIFPDRTNHSAGNWTRTFDSPAVDIPLEDVPHNPRHDLESFFYVLLWLCMEWVRDEATGKMEYCDPDSTSTDTFFPRYDAGFFPI